MKINQKITGCKEQLPVCHRGKTQRKKSLSFGFINLCLHLETDALYYKWVHFHLSP